MALFLPFSRNSLGCGEHGEPHGSRNRNNKARTTDAVPSSPAGFFIKHIRGGHSALQRPLRRALYLWMWELHVPAAQAGCARRLAT